MRGFLLALIAVAVVSLPLQAHASIFGSFFSSSHRKVGGSSAHPAASHPEPPTPTEVESLHQKERGATEHVTGTALSEHERGASLQGEQTHNSQITSHDSLESHEVSKQLGTGANSEPLEPPPQDGQNVRSDERRYVQRGVNDQPVVEKNIAHPGDRQEETTENKIAGSTDNNPTPIPGPLPEPALSDKESTDMTEKALEDMNSELGPQMSKEDRELAQKRSLEDLGEVPSAHRISLSRGIESTMMSLARIYDHLMRAKVTRLSASKTAVQESASVGATVHDSNGFDGDTGPMEAGVIALLTKQRETLKAVISGVDPQQEIDPPIATNVTRPERPSVIGNSDVEDSSTATAVLSVLAGLVFIAAIGLMIAGFAYSQRESQASESTRAPLYPPRGPGFV